MNRRSGRPTRRIRASRLRGMAWAAFFLLLFVAAYVGTDFLSKLGEG